MGTKVLFTKIKELLTKQGKLHKEMCNAIGVTDAGMRKIYARDSCELSTLRRIAEFFGVPIAEFFDETVVAEHNEAYAYGAGSGASNSGNVQVCTQPMPSVEAPNPEDDPRVLHERIRGLEAQLKVKDELIEVLKSR